MSFEKESSHTVVDYDTYIKQCNMNNTSYRRRGILSDTLYNTIVLDSQTALLPLCGTTMPVFMDVRHALAMGYDGGHCTQMAKEWSENIKILTFPIQELNAPELRCFGELIKSQGRIALYFSDHNGEESGTLSQILKESGITWSEKELRDTRASKTDGQAALLLYTCHVMQACETNRKHVSVADVKHYYDKSIAPSLLSDDPVFTTLALGSELSDIQAEEMWILYNERFDFLGNGHPISMQDTKESFIALLRTPNTLVSAVYRRDAEQTKLVCFTYFIDDLSLLYWLNREALENCTPIAAEDSGCVIRWFTPGIVSSGFARSYSLPAIDLVARASYAAGINTVILYENTNLSKRYIPRIVDTAIQGGIPSALFVPSATADTVTYRLWIINAL